MDNKILLEKLISAQLRFIGAQPGLDGFSYTKKAVIKLLADKDKYFHGITKLLYPELAHEFSVSKYNVESSIRDMIKKIPDEKFRCLTNSKFLYYITEII